MSVPRVRTYCIGMWGLSRYTISGSIVPRRDEHNYGILGPAGYPTRHIATAALNLSCEEGSGTMQAIVQSSSRAHKTDLKIECTQLRYGISGGR
jgi:hypothetical protein